MEVLECGSRLTMNLSAKHFLLYSPSANIRVSDAPTIRPPEFQRFCLKTRFTSVADGFAAIESQREIFEAVAFTTLEYDTDVDARISKSYPKVRITSMALGGIRIR